jgi:hypothetical protein
MVPLWDNLISEEIEIEKQGQIFQGVVPPVTEFPKPVQKPLRRGMKFL